MGGSRAGRFEFHEFFCAVPRYDGIRKIYHHRHKHRHRRHGYGKRFHTARNGIFYGVLGVTVGDIYGKFVAGYFAHRFFHGAYFDVCIRLAQINEKVAETPCRDFTLEFRIIDDYFFGTAVGIIKSRGIEHGRYPHGNVARALVIERRSFHA